MDKISAFMDGEAAPAESRQALLRLSRETDSRQAWDAFHLVGDVMRGDPVLRADFVERLHERMAAEPTVLAPQARWRAFADHALAAAAALAGVSVVTALVMTSNPLRPQDELAAARKTGQPVVAQAPEPGAPAAAGASVAQVNGYLMAHQEFSPRTALQGVVPYVRSVASPQDGQRR
jgi:sigma-E factor negative regulatory protein RseA